MRNPVRKKTGLTSVEAAALIQSEGRTKDPEKAAAYANGQELNMDALQRAGLRRQMGFDFEIKVHPRKVMVLAKDDRKIRANAKIKPGDVDEYGNIVNPDLIERLVEACLVLKQKWDAKQSRSTRAGFPTPGGKL